MGIKKKLVICFILIIISYIVFLGSIFWGEGQKTEDFGLRLFFVIVVLVVILGFIGYALRRYFFKPEPKLPTLTQKDVILRQVSKKRFESDKVEKLFSEREGEKKKKREEIFGKF
ncbi:MAG: hypothetical protein V1831_00620 [Candidatus Woesearchaeota archaeon]